jgi:APA family basic amino acid/polyamine antiporter
VGITLVVAIYLLANISYFTVLSPVEMQKTDRAAATAMSVSYGPAATALVTLLIVVSILGSMNGTALTGPRVYFAMAQDGLFFSSFGRIDKQSRAPGLAILVQGVWASCLTLAGGFQELFTYVIFMAWIFYGATVFAVIILRVRKPDLVRPYRVPLYPWLPLLFVLSAGLITVLTIANGPRHALYGIALILLGLPVYGLFFRQPRFS